MKNIKIFEAFIDSYNPDKYPNTWNKDELQMLTDHGFEIDSTMEAHVQITPDVKAYIRKDYEEDPSFGERTLVRVTYNVWFDKKSFFEVRMKAKYKSEAYDKQPNYMDKLQIAMDWIYSESTKKGWIKYDPNNYMKNK
jgi:hypothetical protein